MGFSIYRYQNKLYQLKINFRIGQINYSYV